MTYAILLGTSHFVENGKLDIKKLKVYRMRGLSAALFLPLTIKDMMTVLVCNGFLLVTIVLSKIGL